MTEKYSAGNFFEDFSIGQHIVHATPRTVTPGDVSLYTALYGGRFVVQSSAPFARALGLPEAPIDDLLTFHIVFGKTVPDVSLNAVANLGYADVRFLELVYPWDTLSASSEVIGLKETSSGRTGIVYVRSTGTNQHGAKVLEFMRWVLVRKRDATSPAPESVVPDLPDLVEPDRLEVPEGIDFRGWKDVHAGSSHRWEDYEIGEKINHVDGMTIEAAEHMLATRLYQNTAKVHFNQHVAYEAPLGERIVYGGHVISLARALSFNGLGNACFVAAINAGRHVNPAVKDDTVYAWSKVRGKAEIPGRGDVGALRLGLVALKDETPERFQHKDPNGAYDDAVLLDLDYWVLMPRR